MSAVSTTTCPLCKNAGIFFKNWQDKTYWSCSTCKSVFLHPKFYPSKEAEFERYTHHQNSLYDEGYLAFLQPLIDAIEGLHDPTHKGLDFGSGPTPIMSQLFQEKGWNIKSYDPFFAKNQHYLREKYDFIICCEVMEHFQHPAKEFQQLKNLLLPQGHLFGKTELLTSLIKDNFDQWPYKNDFTHVFFYAPETLTWIKDHFGFSQLILKNDYFILIK